MFVGLSTNGLPQRSGGIISARKSLRREEAVMKNLVAAYEEVLNLLERRGLLTERLPYTPAVFEEAVYFAYKMRVITQGGVRNYLDLDRDGLRELINRWNSGDEGNCTCRMASNPFAEET